MTQPGNEPKADVLRYDWFSFCLTGGKLGSGGNIPPNESTLHWDRPSMLMQWWWWQVQRRDNKPHRYLHLYSNLDWCRAGHREVDPCCHRFNPMRLFFYPPTGLLSLLPTLNKSPWFLFALTHTRCLCLGAPIPFSQWMNECLSSRLWWFSTFVLSTTRPFGSAWNCWGREQVVWAQWGPRSTAGAEPGRRRPAPAVIQAERRPESKVVARQCREIATRCWRQTKWCPTKCQFSSTHCLRIETCRTALVLHCRCGSH